MDNLKENRTPRHRLTNKDNSETRSYATSAYITLIKSPNYPASFDYSRLLKRHFSKPKLLREGQVITIKSSLDFRYQERLQDDLLLEWPTIVWKVTKLEPDTSGFVLKGTTNLYQSGATQAFLNVDKQNKPENDIDQDNDDHNYYNLPITLTKTSYFSKYNKKLLAFLEPLINSSLDFIGTVLLHGRSGCGKRLLLEKVAEDLEVSLCHIEANDLIGENAATTESKIKTALMRAASFAPCLIHITKFDLLCQLEKLDLERVEQNFHDVITLSLNTNLSTWPIAIVATTNDYDIVGKSPLSSIFHSNLEMKCLDKMELQDMVTQLMIHSMKFEHNIVEQFCNNIVKADLFGMYIGNVVSLLTRFDYHLNIGDKTSESIEKATTSAINIINLLRNGPNQDMRPKTQTNWSDVGGMIEIKRHIADAIQLSNDYPQLKLSGMRRSGLLLCGPPGTGKTLLAKAVATEFNLSFISVKGPELINMYVGQSEENVRKVFQRAREQSPSVIFFDELDSLAPSRGQSGDSGGVMDRVVSQILAEMDGITKDEVFVIGATNRIDLIDQSLLRPGRFDKVIEVPLPNDSETRLDILNALTRRMNLSEDIDLREIEKDCPPGMSGADFYSLCANAMNISLMECVDQINNGSIKEADSEILITQRAFKEALTRIA